MSVFDSFDSAVRAFWTGRDLQAQRQVKSGQVDAGTRGAVTGGKHLRPFEEAVAELFTPLVFALGSGVSEKWSAAQLLDGDGEPTSGYSYTAIHFTGDAVLFAYCAGGEADKNRLARLRIRKVPRSILK